MSTVPTSTNLLLAAQQTTGRRQKLLLSLLQLQLLIESGDNLKDDQKAVLCKVINELDSLFPAKAISMQL